MPEAFFFGPTGRQLFGSYHPPARGYGQVMTVICPPLFNDFSRTHRALRKVAVSIAEAGQHVLRFDYGGTGDSFGDLAETDLSDWLRDVVLAVEEGREISGCSEVRMLGVRASALLVCGAELSDDAPERVVLWDPITDGARYLRHIHRAQEEMVDRNFDLTGSERRGGQQDYGTYRLSERMVEEFAAFDLSACLRLPSDKLFVVSTSVDARFPVEGVVPEVVDHPCSWEMLSEDLINPHPVLERLIGCLIMS